MGQVMKKLTGEPTQDHKKKNDITKEIKSIIGRTFNEDVVGKDGVNYDDLYRYIFKIIEELRSTQGVMQYRLPLKYKLIEVFLRHKSRGPLKEAECKAIIKELFTLQSFSLGQGTIDVLIYLFGFPIGALMLMKVMRSIPDDVVILAATSASVFFLAKTHRL